MPFHRPIKKFLKPSHLFHKITKATPIATTAAITKPTGPRKATIAETAEPIQPPTLLKMFSPISAPLASFELPDMKVNAELAA